MLLQLFFSFLAAICARVAYMRWKYDLWRIPSPPGHPFFGHMLKMNDARRRGTFAVDRGEEWKNLGCPKIMKVNITAKKTLIAEHPESHRYLSWARL